MNQLSTWNGKPHNAHADPTDLAQITVQTHFNTSTWVIGKRYQARYLIVHNNLLQSADIPDNDYNYQVFCTGVFMKDSRRVITSNVEKGEKMLKKKRISAYACACPHRREMKPMDMHFGYEPSSAPGSVYSCRPESEFFKTISRRSSSIADTFQELESVGEVVTRFELDMACVCEKLANLNLLLMHMETLQSDFETFVSDTNQNQSDMEVKALEFDFLYGFLNSEVTVLENHISDFQTERTNMQDFVHSSKMLGESSVETEDMLNDSEKSLQQSLDQLAELKTRAAMFEKTVSRFAAGGETRAGANKDEQEGVNNNELPELKDKMTVQTVEHQRHILRMLEKSLERELESEKRASELAQIEEGLTMRLQATEQEVILAEDETVDTLEKLYNADHAAEILMSISKELLSNVKKDSGVQNLETNIVKEMKERVIHAERRAANAEAKCEEVKATSEKLILLEKKLKSAKSKLKLSKSRRDSLEDLEPMMVMMVTWETFQDYDGFENPFEVVPVICLESGEGVGFFNKANGITEQWMNRGSYFGVEKLLRKYRYVNVEMVEKSFEFVPKLLIKKLLKMDATSNYDASSEFSKSSLSLKTSSDNDSVQGSESPVDIIKRFELEISYICEKLANLNLLSMRVESKENAFESLLHEMDPVLVVNALEIDLLSGLLDSELKVLEKHISDIQIEKDHVMELLSSRKHLQESEPLMRMEDMLNDSGRTLEQSLEQILEIKIRSANFQRNLLRFGGDNENTESLEDTDLLELQEKMKLQNVEHQRHILRMLEKSWEREMDLEKKVNELNETKEDLTQKLKLSEQQVVSVQEEGEMTLEKFYEANYKSDLLMETSRELLEEIKMLQFNLKGSLNREGQLTADLVKLKEHTKESQLQYVDEKSSMEVTIKELRQKAIDSEKKYLLQKETSEKLKGANEKLEKQVNDINVKLQHVEACYEASEEEKVMFHETIKDMGNVIEDLKKKVLKSQSETDNVEDKIKSLEECLHKMEESKKATANDISLRTKLITDLVINMAHERERLQKQISSLKQDNKVLVKTCLKKSEGGGGDTVSSRKSDFTTENKESLSSETGPTVCESEPYIARNIDAWQLKPKQYVLFVIILFVSVYLGLQQTQGCGIYARHMMPMWWTYYVVYTTLPSSDVDMEWTFTIDHTPSCFFLPSFSPSHRPPFAVMKMRLRVGADMATFIL
ncbi:hypothetical protein LXL04_013445 [Taraxacum kok-saghyz]